MTRLRAPMKRSFGDRALRWNSDRVLSVFLTFLCGAGAGLLIDVLRGCIR